jgi:hypothetical protein
VKKRKVLEQVRVGEIGLSVATNLLKAFVDRGKQNIKQSFRAGRRGGGDAMAAKRREVLERVKRAEINLDEALQLLHAIEQSTLAKKTVRIDPVPTSTHEMWAPEDYDRTNPDGFDTDFNRVRTPARPPWRFRSTS